MGLSIKRYRYKGQQQVREIGLGRRHIWQMVPSPVGNCFPFATCCQRGSKISQGSGSWLSFYGSASIYFLAIGAVYILVYWSLGRTDFCQNESLVQNSNFRRPGFRSGLVGDFDTAADWHRVALCLFPLPCRRTLEFLSYSNGRYGMTGGEVVCIAHYSF